MRPIYWKLGLTMIFGAIVGTLSGQATIAGMAPPTVTTQAYEPAMIDQPVAAETAGADASGSPDYARIADACDDCSDYDLGYRFAAARRLRTTDQCLDYSWSYQRGCLAYLREG